MDPNKTGSKMSTVSLVVLTILLFFAVVSLGLMTRTVGFTMVCIVDPEYLSSNRTTSQDSTGEYQVTHHRNRTGSINEFDQVTNVNPHGYSGTHKWSQLQQSHVISVPNWAKLVVLPVSAYVLSQYNPSFVLVLGTVAAGLTTAFFPLSVSQGEWFGALVNRLFLGLFEAFAKPSVDALASQLIPAAVKSSAYAVITSGGQVAIFVSSPLSTYFCSHDRVLGWEAFFYMVTLITVSWTFCWIVYLILSPRQCPSKSSTSLGWWKNNWSQNKLIPASAQEHHLWVNPKQAFDRTTLKQRLVPFYDNIIADRALWGVYPCNLAATWTVSLYTYYLPQYYRDVLQVSLTHNGYFSALPFLVQTVSKICLSLLADWLKRVTRFNPSTISKVFNAIGLAGCGGCVLLTSTQSCQSPTYATLLICLGYALYPCTTPGFITSYISVNPEWAGVISSVCTIFAVIGGLVFPYMVASLVPSSNPLEWRTLFWVIFAVDVVAVGLYFIFGSVKTREERVKEDRDRYGKTWQLVVQK